MFLFRKEITCHAHNQERFLPTVLVEKSRIMSKYKIKFAKGESALTNLRICLPNTGLQMWYWICWFDVCECWKDEVWWVNEPMLNEPSATCCWGRFEKNLEVCTPTLIHEQQWALNAGHLHFGEGVFDRQDGEGGVARHIFTPRGFEIKLRT